MNLVQSILDFLSRGKTTEDAPEGLCPNCWGRQKYGERFYEAIKNENVDVNHASERIGWVQDYADKHLKGIQLHRQGDELVCNTCKLTYRPS